MISFIPYVFAADGIINPVLLSAGTGSGSTILGNIISAMLGLFLLFGFIMALFHFLIGAFTWITASGDKQKLENAQDRITQAVIGLIIMFAVWAIMLILGQFFGIGFPKLTIPSINNSGAPSDSGGGGGGEQPPTCSSNATCTTANECINNLHGQVSGQCGYNMFCCIAPSSAIPNPCLLPNQCRSQVDCYSKGGGPTKEQCPGTNDICCTK